MKNKEVVLMVAHGSSGKESDDILHIVRRLHTLMHPGCEKSCVNVAYLQFQKPDVQSAIENAVHDGAEKIVVHPYFLSRGFHVMVNIAEMLKNARKKYPNVQFVCTEPLGVHENLADVVLAIIRETAY